MGEQAVFIAQGAEAGVWNPAFTTDGDGLLLTGSVAVGRDQRDCHVYYVDVESLTSDFTPVVPARTLAHHGSKRTERRNRTEWRLALAPAPGKHAEGEYRGGMGNGLHGYGPAMFG